MARILCTTLCILSAASVLMSCGGGRASSGAGDPIVTAVVDVETPSTPTPAAQDDLLILTPSAHNIPKDKIAVAVDGLAISHTEYQAGLSQFIENHPGLPDPESAYLAQLREELLLLAYVRDELALKEDDFRYRARAELRETIAALVLERTIDSRITVSEREIQSRYETDRPIWLQPPRVIVELILVATRAEAQALVARIEAGESFAELARVFSLHSSSQRGGSMEPFRRGTYSAALEDVAFRLRPGEVGTADTERGIFILRKIADSSETITPLEDVRDQIAQIIREEKRAAERAAFLSELEQRYPAPANHSTTAQP